jgi:hypothetical protein
MQITINLDKAILKEGLQLTNLTTQEELLNLTLQEVVRSCSYRMSKKLSSFSETLHHKKNLLDLAGQIQFTLDFGHKAMRETPYVTD